MDKRYVDAVRLLLNVAPDAFAEPGFALKGGTAINLFINAMPRLSVDIDIVYTDHQTSRETAIASIASRLNHLQSSLADRGLQTDLAADARGEESKLFIRRGGSQIKIEINRVFRGTLMDVDHRQICPEAQDAFATNLTVPVLATAELFGSKLVAAMDRQHPRDFFDVLGMFATCGLTREIVDCFVSYLAGHNRPVHEALFPNKLNIAPAFENEFVGMTKNPIKLEELRETQERLFRELPAALTDNHRKFLLGIVSDEPDWELIGFPHLSELPAVRWKIENIRKLKRANPHKFTQQTEELAACFEKA